MNEELGMMNELQHSRPHNRVLEVRFEFIIPSSSFIVRFVHPRIAHTMAVKPSAVEMA